MSMGRQTITTKSGIKYSERCVAMTDEERAKHKDCGQKGGKITQKVIIPCKLCGNQFERKAFAEKFCEICRPQARRDRNNAARSEARRIAREAQDTRSPEAKEYAKKQREVIAKEQAKEIIARCLRPPLDLCA